MHIVCQNDIEQNDVIGGTATRPNVGTVREQESELWRLPSFLSLPHDLEATPQPPHHEPGAKGWIPTCLGKLLARQSAQEEKEVN